MVLQSKCGICFGEHTNYYDFSKEHILSSVEASLQRLNTDYLDILLLHRPDTLMDPKEIAEAFEDYYECFLQTKDLSYLMTKYNEWLVSRRKEVRVLDPKGEFTGISKGINEKGELLVELPNGEVTAIYAGEVSVRGLYGYV